MAISNAQLAHLVTKSSTNMSFKGNTLKISLPKAAAQKFNSTSSSAGNKLNRMA